MQEHIERYHKRTAIRAVSITDADLEELRTIMAEDVHTDESLELAIESDQGDRTTKTSSISSFVQQLDGTAALDSLEVHFYIWAGSGTERHDLTKSAWVSLHRNCVVASDLYVSSADRTWCYGKSQVLARFFRRKHLWYWGVAGEFLPWILSWIFTIQLSVFAYFLLSRTNSIATVVSGLFCLGSAIMFVQTARAVLFPGFIFSRVAASKPSLMMNQAFSTAVAAIAAVVSAVVGVVSVVLGRLR